MGFKTKNEERKNKKQAKDAQKTVQKSDYQIQLEELLKNFDQKIEELPARNNLKRLLKKCIVGLFLGEKIDIELMFLNDVKKLLNKVRYNYSDQYYTDLLEIIDEVYLLAVDKQYEAPFIQEDPQNKKTEDILKALQNSEAYHPYYFYYDFFDEMGYYRYEQEESDNNYSQSQNQFQLQQHQPSSDIYINDEYQTDESQYQYDDDLMYSEHNNTQPFESEYNDEEEKCPVYDTFYQQSEVQQEMSYNYQFNNMRRQNNLNNNNNVNMDSDNNLNFQDNFDSYQQSISEIQNNNLQVITEEDEDQLDGSDNENNVIQIQEESKDNLENQQDGMIQQKPQKESVARESSDQRDQSNNLSNDADNNNILLKLD